MMPIHSPTTAGVPVPPLKEGDRLTRDEFERRYNAMPELPKAELIAGAVVMPSPVRLKPHGRPHALLVSFLVAYWGGSPPFCVGDNSTIRLDNENEPQPDALLLLEPEWGGQARYDAEEYVEGGPELVAEVAASSVNIDLKSKLQMYASAGVREYVVWRVLDRAVDWFVLRAGQYVPLAPTSTGAFHSEVFPGLWLQTDALLNLDYSSLLQYLQQGKASREYQDFLAGLRQRGSSS